MSFYPIFCITLLFFSAVEPAYLGEPCHPLVPDLHCVTGGNMHCALQQDGFSYRCECNYHHNSNLAGTYCHGTYGAGCVEFKALDCNAHRRMSCFLEPVFIGTCYCSNPSTLMYREDIDSCVARAGRSCHMNATTPFGLSCVPNSDCDDAAGTEVPNCKCRPGYDPDVEGRCVRSGGLHGAQCDNSDTCDYDVHHLICLEGTCQCGSGYVPNSFGKCVRVYGAKCSEVDPCDTANYIGCSSTSGHPGVCTCEEVEHQIYEESIRACRTKARKYYGGAPCVANAARQSINGTCECDPGFIATHEGRCRPVEFPELGDPCEADGPTCIADTWSECTADANNATSCQCPPDRSSDQPGHRCYLRYGQRCVDVAGRYCNTDRQLECDLFVNLCRCFNQFNTIYDAGRDACFVLTGGKCTNGDTEFDQRCVDNASCQGSNGCRCDAGFVETEDRRCTPASTSLPDYDSFH
ncbi:multiple epidermal growth factor-like domains protein 6 [Folsomia candida]|uniref:EGF-like domain-containing protein n=1 Tax=Folsomia candida TaxID=158441 RepID=A0A226DKY8_FOLCA|nr:multiple epidermal growth factor-like domains protein 6 [Folsomia candida]OXA45337.1 hypothetical protein Fcan01_19827 [Folsomia candida]